MFDRVGEYLRRATALRLLSRRTEYPEIREQLLVFAAAFDRLAQEAEKWEAAGHPRAAAD